MAVLNRLLGPQLSFVPLVRWKAVLVLALLFCARTSLAQDEGDDLRKPMSHTASTTCPEKIPVWQCLRLSWSAPPCRTNFDCAMPFPCCVTWCRNFCANDFRA